MKTPAEIASQLAPHIGANNAAIGETNRRIVKIGDGQGNPRPATLLTPRDVFYRSSLDQNDRGVAILSSRCPIPLQAIDGYYDQEVWIANIPGTTQPVIVDTADVGGFATDGPTPAEGLANSAAFPDQSRIVLLRLRPSDAGGISVFVDVGPYAVAYEPTGGGEAFFTSQDFGFPDPTDDTIFNPTASALSADEHRIVAIVLDPATGALVAVPGVASTASGTLPQRDDFDQADYEAIDLTGYYAAGYVYTYFGQEELVEDDILRLYDPRILMNKLGGSANLVVSDGSTTVNPVTEIDFTGATVTDLGGGVAGVTISGGGSGTLIGNLLQNGSFETWENGTSSAPSDWTVTGSGATIAREGSIIKHGLYSAKLTRSGTDCNFTFDAFANLGRTYIQSRDICLGVWVYATVANRARLRLDDGTTVTNSSYHPGDSAWHFLTVAATVGNSATSVKVGFQIDTGNTSAYMDGAVLVEGVTVSDYTPQSHEFNYIPKRAILLHRASKNTVGNALTWDQTNLQAYQNSSNNGDTFTQGFWLQAGTYTFEVLGNKADNRGIVDWYVDGVPIVTGQDWYASPQSSGVVISNGSITVNGDGYHILKGVVNGKNASSSNYFITLWQMWFIPGSD